jgi:hypothetical protein
VRPLISLANPARNQVPSLVRIACVPLVPSSIRGALNSTQQIQFVEVQARSDTGHRSQQKVSNSSSRVATRASGAAIHEHVTTPIATGHHAVRAFGTKSP